MQAEILQLRKKIPQNEDLWDHHVDMKYDLSRLKKLDLRHVWNHEAHDFTQWLSLPENLDLLSEEVGIEIKPVGTEANVGKFRVDLIAEEEGSGRKIIIENQLEQTNHDHLGKIITYAAGYDADVIIWVVSEAREEHERAIEWLNEHTEEKFGFFLIQLELWQIDDSKPAAKFHIIESPNEWAKAIKSDAGDGEVTETKLKQLHFWAGFQEFAPAEFPQLRLGRTPKPQHWYSISIGSSRAHISLSLDTRKNRVACEIYINRDKEMFAFLSERKVEIERELGLSLEYIDAPIASRIKVSHEVEDIFDPAIKLELYRWFGGVAQKFQSIFGRHLKEYKTV